MCVLAMIALTMVAVGLTLALPTMLRAIPLSGIQQLQGGSEDSNDHVARYGSVSDLS